MRYCRNADHVLVSVRIENHGEIPRSLRLRPVRQRKPAMAGPVPDVRRRRFAAARGRRSPRQAGATRAGREQRRAAAVVAGRRARRAAHADRARGARSRAGRRPGAGLGDAAGRRSRHRQVNDAAAGRRRARAAHADALRHRRGIAPAGQPARPPPRRSPATRCSCWRRRRVETHHRARAQQPARACSSSTRSRRCSRPSVESSPGSAAQVRESAARARALRQVDPACRC